MQGYTECVLETRLLQSDISIMLKMKTDFCYIEEYRSKELSDCFSDACFFRNT